MTGVATPSAYAIKCANNPLLTNPILSTTHPAMTSQHTKSHPSILPPEKAIGLTEHGFIKKLNAEQQELVIKASQTLHYVDNSIIFHEGNPSDAIFLLLKGKVLFFKNSSTKNNPHIISSCDTGDYFGEIGILSRSVRALSAKAMGEVILVKIPANAIDTLLPNEESLLGDLIASIIRRLQNTSERFQSEIKNQEKLAMVGMMMSSILHDFKNPFSLVKMATHLIRSRNSNNNELEKYCATIDRQIERMLAMMNDIIAFSKGQETAHAHPFHLSALKSQLEENISHFKLHGNCKINLDFCDGKIVADCGKILRALTNLFDNAFDAASSSQLKNGEVTVTAKVDNDKVIFSVRDNGPGIPEEIREYFFEPFVTSNKKGGTGLGLAITKSVVDAHHGSITFTTQTNEGTCFIIELPVGEVQ
jgi:signal transduction histidine kinase